MRGSVPMVTTPINTSSDPEKHFLQTVEIGAQLQYSWLYEYVDNIIDKNEIYYDRYYKDTFEQAKKYAKRMEDFNSAIGDSKIMEHYQLSDTLTAVTYDNGVSVYVNYSNDSQLYGEIQIPALDFVIIK